MGAEHDIKLGMYSDAHHISNWLHDFAQIKLRWIVSSPGAVVLNGGDFIWKVMWNECSVKGVSALLLAFVQTV